MTHYTSKDKKLNTNELVILQYTIYEKSNMIPRQTSTTTFLSKVSLKHLCNPMLENQNKHDEWQHSIRNIESDNNCMFPYFLYTSMRN